MRRGGIYRRLPRAAATEDRLREVAQVNYSFFHRDPPIRTPRTQSAGDEEDHGNFLSKGYLWNIVWKAKQSLAIDILRYIFAYNFRFAL